MLNRHEELYGADAATPAARSVLALAERTSRELGHENLGFLSEARGFMPLESPHRRLPREFSAWDEAAQALPHLYASLGLRRALDALPCLPATRDHLPDASLLRASSVLALLVHAYQYVESRPPSTLPEALLRPWAEVRERLDRTDPVLSYIDLIVYNFRLLDAQRADPFRVENMRLLTPTVNTPEERRFYLVQTEILAQSGPIVGATVRAQEAALRDDREALVAELELIAERLGTVTRSLLKIDPNPAGRSHVDPVVWAKTVAPFAVPIGSGMQGPSGTSSPLFNLLDTFLGRKKHETFLGREIRDLRRGYPRHWRDFLSAVGEISVPEAIARTGDRHLKHALEETIELYSGTNGFLDRHRLKVYGYLELAFKVGRSVTIGGFAGLFKDRTWDQVDAELEASRQERVASLPVGARQAAVVSAHAIEPGVVSHATRVRLAFAGSPARSEPGDRCGVLAENDPALVERTLDALEATGAESVELTQEWREHLRLRPGDDARDSLTLRELLRFGRIRPVVPRVAEALHAVSQDPRILALVRAQTSARYELWELLEDLRENGFDTRRLWRSPAAASHYVGRVVPPETFRMYSISSASPPAQAASELELTVGRVLYREPSATRAPDAVRAGTASNFLSAAAGRSAPIAVVLEHPPRFELPGDPTVPIVMIAGGTGIAPFMSFIRRRATEPRAGTAWLYWGLRSRADFGYRCELAEAVRAGKLRVEVAFSREDLAAEFTEEEAGHFAFVRAPRRRVTDVVLAPAARERLHELLMLGGGDGRAAHVYVCGRSRFARSVEDALRRILHSDSEAGSGDQRLAALAGEGRYRREVFTDPHAPPADEASFVASDVVIHNDDEHGYWQVIEGRVYDLTPFIALHPGGVQVLRGYAGMDATQGYARAHARATEVAAMREMYAVGTLRRPYFANATRTVTRAGTTQVLSIAALHRAWLGFTYLTVEMQNALRADLSLQFSVTARDDPATPRSLYKLDRALETQDRFLKSYAGELGGSLAVELWELTECLCRGAASSFMLDALAELRGTTDMRYLEALGLELRRLLSTLTASRELAPAEAVPRRERLLQGALLLESQAARLLSHAKGILREGLVLFEQHEASVLEQAGGELLALLGRLPLAILDYARAVRSGAEALGFELALSAEPASVPPPAPRGPRVITSNAFWVLEHDGDRNVALLRRSAAGVTDLNELAQENERIIERLSGMPGCRGVVVDTRQAPARNDPHFERTMLPLRSAIYRAGARVAVLVTSVPGVLQVERIGRDDDARTLVTVSEAAALQFAMGQT